MICAFSNHQHSGASPPSPTVNRPSPLGEERQKTSRTSWPCWATLSVPKPRLHSRVQQEGGEQGPETSTLTVLFPRFLFPGPLVMESRRFRTGRSSPQAAPQFPGRSRQPPASPVSREIKAGHGGHCRTRSNRRLSGIWPEGSSSAAEREQRWGRFLWTRS